jgi:hypothetical protein
MERKFRWYKDLTFTQDTTWFSPGLFIAPYAWGCLFVEATSGITSIDYHTLDLKDTTDLYTEGKLDLRSHTSDDRFALYDTDGVAVPSESVSTSKKLILLPPSVFYCPYLVLETDADPGTKVSLFVHA